jgi:hypothetical protein
MEVVEQTTAPNFSSVPAIAVQPLETSSSNLQVSEIAYFCGLIRKHASTEVCPLPPESPSLSQPKYMLFGAQAPPRPDDPRLSAKAVAALPPSPLSLTVANSLQYSA